MIGVDIASLVLEVDATRVDKATESLIKLAEAGERAESGDTKRVRSSKSATESLKEQTSATTAQAAADKALALEKAYLHKVMLRSAEMTGTLSIQQGVALEKERLATEKLIATSRVRQQVMGLTETTGIKASNTIFAGILREEAATEKLRLATEKLAISKERAFRQGIIDQKMREAGLRDKAEAAAAFDASPAGIYKAAGVKDPRLIAEEIDSVRKAQEELRREYAAGDVTQQAYAKTQDDLHKRMNLLTEGNVRHRGAIRQTAAAMASLAFEAAGAAFLVTAVGGALTAPALYGIKLGREIEDAQLGLASILISMGRIGDQSVRLPQALVAAKKVTDELLGISIRYGVNVSSIVDTMRSITAPGLAAGMNLKEIQDIATVGTIAVKTIGLDARQSVQEIRDLVAGGIQAASSTLANTIGVRDSDVTAWRKAGIVYEELMSRLKGYMTTAELSTQTMSGAIENVKTKFAALMMDENGFKGLTRAIIDLGNFIGTIDPVTKKFELNPTLVVDVKAYWQVLKEVGSVIKDIGVIGAALLPIFGPIVSIVANTVSTLSYVIRTALDGTGTLLALAAQGLTLDFAGAKRTWDAWATRDQARFDDYASSITSADTLLRGFNETQKEAAKGMQTPLSLAGVTSYRSKGFDSAPEITGGTNTALAAASKTWDQYVGVTREGLDRAHKMQVDQFAEDAKLLKKAREQEFIGTAAQTKAHWEALREEEVKFNLAVLGERKKYKEAIAALEKKSDRTSAYQSLIAGLEATAAQAGTTQTSLERVNAELRKADYKRNTESEKEYARSLAASNDQRAVSLAYASTVTSLGDTEVKSLQSRVDAQEKHNLSIGQTKEVSNELLAAREELLAVSLLQQASDIESANQLEGPYKAANLELARRLKERAKLTRELAGKLIITSEKEAALAATKAAEAAEKEWRKAVNKIEGGFHKAFLSIADKGVSVWDTMTQAFRKMFKTTVLEYIYRELAKPMVLRVIASVAGVMGAQDMAQAAAKEGGSNLLSSAGTSAAGSWVGSASAGVSAFSGGVSAGMYGGFGAANSISGAAFGTSMAGTAASVGSYVGAAMPYIAAYMGGVAIAGDKKLGGLSGKDSVAIGAAIGTAILPGIGTMVGMLVGGATNRLFGMGPRKFEATKLVGQFDGAGFEGDLQTKWREKGGTFRSDDTGTDITALTDVQKGAFDAIAGGTKQAFDSLITISGEAARSLDDWSFAVNHEIKTQEQQTALVKELADSMGERLIPELEGFRKEGESLADTAIRLRDEFYITDKLVQILGKDTVSAFGTIGLASAGARDRLVEVAGGMSSLSSLTQGYYDNFFSAEEKLANDTKSLVAAFGQLGITVPKSKDAFKSLVEAQDLSTDAGQRMFVSLLALAPALAGVMDAGNQLAESSTLLADKRRLEISLMEASGNASGALAAKRADELSSLDASLRPLQEQIYAQQDLTSVYDRVSASLKNMKLQTQDAFSTAFEYTKYLRKADLAGIQGAKDALASPETTFTPGDPGVQAQVALLAAIEKLRADMQAGNIASVETLLAMAKAITKWDGDGMPQPRTY